MRLLLLFPAVISLAPARAVDPPPTPAPESQPAYRSAFADYRNFKDEPLGSWREANEAMGRLGGHMGHAGDPDMPTSEPPQEKQGDTKSRSDPHAGHHGGGKP